MKEWIHDLWIFALLKKFAPMYLVSRWIYEKRWKLLKEATRNLWSAMVTLILFWFLLYFLLGWSMSYCTVLERMQTLLPHAGPAQGSFWSRQGHCLCLVLFQLADILDASIPLASKVVNIQESKFKATLELLKLQGRWIDQAFLERYYLEQEQHTVLDYLSFTIPKTIFLCITISGQTSPTNAIPPTT